MPGINVGIDVAKDELAVAVLPSGESFIELNDERAVMRLVQRLSALGCERIVLEASGGYETLVAGALAGGIAGGGGQPAPGARFRACDWTVGQDRPLDARVIALYAERVQPPIRQLPDEQTRALRELCVRRAELIEMLVAERNRLRMASKATRHEIAGHVDYLCWP